MTHEEKKAMLKSVIDERGDLVKHKDQELIDMHFVEYTDNNEFIIRVNIPDWLMAAGTVSFMRLMPADENPTIVEA